MRCMFPGCMYNWQHGDESALCMSLFNISYRLRADVYSIPYIKYTVLQKLQPKYYPLQTRVKTLLKCKKSESEHYKLVGESSCVDWTAHFGLRSWNEALASTAGGEHAAVNQEHTAAEIWNHLSFLQQHHRDKCVMSRSVCVSFRLHIPALSRWYLNCKCPPSFSLDHGVRLTFFTIC